MHRNHRGMLVKLDYWEEMRAFLKFAALTIRSSTKYLGGHGSAICGMVNVGWTGDTAFVAEDAELCIATATHGWHSANVPARTSGAP